MYIAEVIVLLTTLMIMRIYCNPLITLVTLNTLNILNTLKALNPLLDPEDI